MSTGGAGADSGRLYKYGASHARNSPNGDFTEEQAREINARYRGTDKASKSGSGGSGILSSLKEALRPGDSRGGIGKRIVIGTGTGAGTGTRETAADNTNTTRGRGGRRAAADDTMQPGRRQDYRDASEEPLYDHPRDSSKIETGSSCGNGSSGARRGVMGTVKSALAGGREHTHFHARAHHESYRDATGTDSSAAGAFGSSPPDNNKSSLWHKGGGGENNDNANANANANANTNTNANSTNYSRGRKFP